MREAPPFGHLSKGGELSAAKKKAENKSFKIAGGQAGMEVSWQLTGRTPGPMLIAFPSKRKNPSLNAAVISTLSFLACRKKRASHGPPLRKP